jgi:diguanylate cyclase (GGDEF)-like protein
LSTPIQVPPPSSGGGIPIDQKVLREATAPTRVPRAWELWLGLLFGFIVAGLFFTGVFTELEHRTIDTRFRSRGSLPHQRSVVLIGITDECIGELGTWPWPRATHAHLLERLTAAGAKVVGFDIMFNEPSLHGPDDDRLFAEAIATAGNVVLPLVVQKRLILDPDSFEMIPRITPERALPELRAGALGEGFIDMEYQAMNPDGVIRHLYLTREVGSETWPVFGLELAARQIGASISTTDGGVRVGDNLLPLYTRWDPMHGHGWVRSYLMNYGGPTSHFDEISYHEVLRGAFPEGFFRNRAVIVGTRAKGTSEDVKFCPFGALAGMEIHGNLIANVTTGPVLQRLAPGPNAVGLVFLGLVLGLVLWYIPGMAGNLITMGALGGWWALGWAIFRSAIVLELIPVAFLLPIQWAATRLIQQFVALRERKRELAKRVRELSIVNEVSQAVNFMGDLNRTLDTILSRAVFALGAARGSLFMLDERYETLVEQAVMVGVAQDAQVDPDLKARFKDGEGIAGEVFASGKPRLVADVARETAFAAQSAYGIRTMICVPLAVRETPIGVMNIVNKDSGVFDQEDLQLALTMANQAAVVVEKARLFNLATVDGLTGLIVHRHFQAKLEEEFRRAKRYDKPLSYLMTDIDHFKKFNDTWGHQTGDMVLREVARCVRGAIRDTDIAARYGGEEFAIILPETDLEGAALFAERLRQKVESAVFAGPAGPLQVTISLGLSSVPHCQADTTLEMIKLADEALYSAKHAGRNRVGVAPAAPEAPASPENSPPTP